MKKILFAGLLMAAALRAVVSPAWALTPAEAMSDVKTAAETLVRLASAAVSLIQAGETEGEESDSMTKIEISFQGRSYSAVLEQNSSAQAFAALLAEKGGSLEVDMQDYGGFEKVGPLGATLPRNDRQITTSAGDLILYQGNQITLYYGQNSWNFTRLGRLEDPSGLQEALGTGGVRIRFALSEGRKHNPWGK